MLRDRRFLAIFLPHLPTDRCARQADDAADPAARATFAAVKGGLVLAATCARAERAGLRPGLGLAEARARLPDLRAERHAPEADRALLRRTALAAQRWSPSVAIEDDASGLRLDATGVAHLFGGEAGLLADIRARLKTSGFAARACIADTQGAAWAGARFHPDPASVFPPGATRAALAGLPAAGLRLEAEDLEALGRLGLRRVGDLYPLADGAGGRAALARRFGPAIARRLFQALGAEDEPFVPEIPAPALRVHLAFAEPVSAPEDLARALDRLAGELCARLEAAGLGARRAALTFHRVDGDATRLALGTSRATRDAAALRRLFAEHLGRVDPGFGFERATLDAELVAGLVPEQRRFADAGPAADEDHAPEMAPLVDRLANRLGAANVARLAHVESRLPERAQARVAPLAPLPAALRGARPPARPRPLRLFAHPEPIDVAAELPDAPPLLFRWRRRVHHVAAADGPERIAAEWWRRHGAPRDYYRVEDRDGRRYWVFRDGLWTPDRDGPPRWYLHGLFA